MTLQELFRTTDFDQMFDYIVKFHPQSASSKLAYEVAYEQLCEFEPVKGDDTVRVTMRELDEDDKAPEINVWCHELEGCNWNEPLGCEVVVDDAVKDAPQAMIAGMCLWHITFYGFSPEEQHQKFESWTDDKPSDKDDPDNDDDILSEATKALYPDFGSLDDDDYDKQYEVYSEACLKELRELAAKGDVFGLFFLGKVYDEGFYGVEPDKKKALNLYHQSAAKGYYKAQNNVGQFYEHGIGTEVDLEKAREYYHLSAQSDKSKGNPEENLGLLELRCGNKDEALRWLQKAVDKGNVSMKPYIWYIGRKETWVTKWRNKQ